MKLTRSVGIRGAGLAGLTLAQRIIERDSAATVTVFDTRPCLPHPKRTFCFFRRGFDAKGVAAAKSWRSVRFIGSDFDRSVGCSEAPYTLVRGDDYFARTLEFLSRQNVVLRWSCPDVVIQPGGISTGGESFKFDVVVDTAFDGTQVQAKLWQSFAGIVVDLASDVFDPEEALVMDFITSTAESPVGFVYVLPFSPSQALVEHTTFSVTPRSEEEHIAGCRRWLERRGGVVRRELSREYGAIPMGLKAQSRDPWPVIGTAGGGVRAGTGYGFVGIHRQADRLAQAIVSGQRLSRRWRFMPTPLSLRIGDALFLRALSRAPHQGRTIIEGLLRRASDRDIVAFLSGDAAFPQSLRVMSGVPRLTMVRALCG